MTNPPLLVGIVVVSILLMLVRPKNIPEVVWIGSGTLLLLLLGLIPAADAAAAVAKGSDVYFFLTGMMLLSELARQQGVFDWVSGRAVRLAGNSSSRLFSLIYALGTLVTICLSNDATAVVLTPAVLSAVKKSGAPPLPYLFSCAMIANAASFVLPISNPANLVVFHDGMPPLSGWLTSFSLPSLLSIAATYFVLRWWFRDQLAGDIQPTHEGDEELTRGGKLVLAGLLVVVGVLLAASAKNQDLGLPTLVAALVIVAVTCLKSRTNPLNLARKVSWSTLLLVAGLFVMVEAVEKIGLLDMTQSALHRAQELPVALGVFAIGFIVAIGNNLVNNLPLGLVAGSTIQAAQAKGVLVSATLVGVDLGPNLSVTGSLATILWLIALRREDQSVSFWDFLKVGALAMPIALACSLEGLVLVGH